MFGSGPTNQQWAAMSEVISAQTEMLNALNSRIDALANYVNVVADNGIRPRADTHFLKGLLAGLIAEISGRSDDPFRELADILRRVKFTAGEFMIDDINFNQCVDEAADLVCEHAETYLRRGDQARR